MQFWWVILFIFLCLGLYEQGMQKRDRDYARLKEQWNSLQLDKQIALETQTRLIRRMNSQSDPAWIELVLMQKLGLVPEDQVKVFFSTENP